MIHLDRQVSGLSSSPLWLCLNLINHTSRRGINMSDWLPVFIRSFLLSFWDQSLYVSESGILECVYQDLCLSDGLSIPFFHLGRRTASSISSLSRSTPFRVIPECLTLTRRIVNPVGHSDADIEVAAEQGMKGNVGYPPSSETPMVVVMTLDRTKESTKHDAFNAGLIEGKHILVTDGLRLPGAVMQQNDATAVEWEHWKEDPSSQSPSPSSSLGPSAN